MKKILLTILIILLAILAYFAIANGIKIGSFEILSVAQIQEKNENLDKNIETLNGLITKSFPQKMQEIKQATESLQTAKTAYLDKTTSYTDEQILAATQEEQYDIEFLWTTVGGHATDKGVNIRMEIVNGDTAGISDLNFTVQGSYIAITDFIYAVEEDEDLNFRVKNFKMVPSSGDILQATFKVKNVKIIGNTSTATVNQTTTQTNNTNTTDTSTTNTNTTNTNTQQSTDNTQQENTDNDTVAQ